MSDIPELFKKEQRIRELEEENERLREDAEILRAEIREYKDALQDARHVIKEAVERIKPLWPFVAAWLPDTADRVTEDSNRVDGGQGDEPADRAPERERMAELSACEPYLKEGETPVQCIERNRYDVQTTTRLYQKEREENQRLKLELITAHGQAQENLEEIERLKEELAVHGVQIGADPYAIREDAERWRKMLPLLIAIQPELDKLIDYSSTASEYEPNRLVRDINAAIDAAKES